MIKNKKYKKLFRLTKQRTPLVQKKTEPVVNEIPFLQKYLQAKEATENGSIDAFIKRIDQKRNHTKFKGVEKKVVFLKFFYKS